MQIMVIDHKNPGVAEEIRRVSFEAYHQEAKLLGLAEADFFHSAERQPTFRQRMPSF